MKRIAFTLLLFCYTLLLQAQVTITIANCVAGDLTNRLSSPEKSSVTNLAITGTIDAQDFKTMRDDLPLLSVLNIAEVAIATYTGTDGPMNPSPYVYPANEFPWCSFYNPNTGISKTSLSSVTLPTSNITSIGRSAFTGCSNLTTLVIPTSVTEIGNWAFYRSGNSLSINIPAGLTNIQNFAFEGLNGIITVDAANANYSSDDGVLFNKLGTTLIQCPTSKTGSYVIPSTVTVIGMNAFAYCSQLTSPVNFPGSLNTISPWAFRDCTGFSGTLTIPASVVSIGSGAFSNCTGFTSIIAYPETPIDLSSTSSVFGFINKTKCILYVPVGSVGLYEGATFWTDFIHIAEISCPMIATIPYSQDFSSGALPECWTMVDRQSNGQLWRFNNPKNREILTTTHKNGFAILDSDDFGAGYSQNCDLISPVFDFTDYTDITLNYSQYFRYYQNGIATASYSIDNGANWTSFQTMSGSSTPNPHNYGISLSSALSGKSQVLFKWNYIGTWDWYWAFDDVTVTGTLNPVPVNCNVANQTIGYESICFDAYNTVTVAGNGSSVIIENGSVVSLVAGQSISLLPGFHAQSGSNMHAYITTNGIFCDGVSGGSPIVANPAEKSVAQKETPSLNPSIEKSVKVFPNPNNGQFTLELNNVESGATVNIYNMLGTRVYQATATNEASHKINLPGIRKGIYFVKVIDQKEQFTKKMVVE